MSAEKNTAERNDDMVLPTGLFDHHARRSDATAELHQLTDSDVARLAPRKACTAFLLIGIAITLPVLAGAFGTGDVQNHVTLCGVSVALLALACLQFVIGLHQNTSGFIRWRIGPWYLLWAGFAFGITSMGWLTPQADLQLKMALPGIIDALVVVGVSIILWTIGYLSGPPRFVSRFARRGLLWLLAGTTPAIRGGWPTPWVLYGIGSAARLTAAILTGRFNYVGNADVFVTHSNPYDQVLSLISMFAVFAIATAAFQAFSSRSLATRATLSVLVCIELGVGAVGGMKESFFLTALAVLIPYGAVRGRMPIRLMVISALLLLWIIIPFNSTYRTAINSAQRNLSPSAAVAAAPKILSDVLGSSSLSNIVYDAPTFLAHRLRLVDSVAIIVQLTPATVPYRNPAEFVLAPFIGMVPRAVWPEKPVYSLGYQFGQEYFGLPSAMYSATAITPQGDLYRHGGWPILIIGMMVLGVGCRLFDSAFQPERDPRAVFFILVFLPNIVTSEMDFFSIVMGIPTGLLTAALAARLICRNPRRLPLEMS